MATKKGGKAPVEYVEKDDWFVYPGKLLDKPKLYMRYLREMRQLVNSVFRSSRDVLA